jgi:hypothetical protein
MILPPLVKPKATLETWFVLIALAVRDANAVLYIDVPAAAFFFLPNSAASALQGRENLDAIAADDGGMVLLAVSLDLGCGVVGCVRRNTGFNRFGNNQIRLISPTGT